MGSGAKSHRETLKGTPMGLVHMVAGQQEGLGLEEEVKDELV